MMDLSEIRKKAQRAHKKGSNVSKDMSEPLQPKIVQSENSKTESQHAPSPLRSEGSERSSKKIDPIEALFASIASMESVEEGDASYDVTSLTTENYDSEIRQWLCFSLDDEEYAVDIENIREIIKPREITDIPRVPDFVLGIISLRGIIIPVFDLKRRLRMGFTSQNDESRIVVCQYEDRTVGLLVDRIAQVVRIPARCIEPPPAVLSGVDRDMVEGVGRSQDRMMIQLCLSSVLDAEYI